MSEKLLVELSSPGRKGFSLPELDVPKKKTEELIPKDRLREELPSLPELSEVDVARHFIRLSIMNHHVDKGFYPLGSCTMKYNPKINEALVRLNGLAHLHPFQTEDTYPGALKLMFELGEYVEEISGMDEISLQPAAGAHGELTSLLIIHAYHKKNKSKRTKVIIPDSAHGTNPASVITAGFSTMQIKSNSKGLIDVEELKKAMGEDVAALMITNPNTLGLFETDILEIARVVHDAGALLYMDGANLNALMGIAKPGDMGFDVVHFNLHKTFSTPHGGGGPGSGPVGVKENLAPFLPVPVVVKRAGKKETEEYHLDYKRPQSIGRMHSFYGNFGVMVRAYVYIRQNGAKGLREVSENAIINANYLREILKQYYHLPYDDFCQHEFVLSGDRQKEKGVKTLDIAKRLLDFGLHAPTVYFPLIVHEALMIEPTETESKESLDEFADAMIKIAKEVEENPGVVTSAPHVTPVGRLDEVKAAKDLNLRWKG
ncbi:MAG TPA: aminomethyl-transferring glycine dehydrogenase subunit GcvPB [candidate division Zixibacteria bacterium]